MIVERVFYRALQLGAFDRLALEVIDKDGMPTGTSIGPTFLPLTIMLKGFFSIPGTVASLFMVLPLCDV